MADILRFLNTHNASFDAEATAILGIAYDQATAALHDTGQPEMVCELIADRIIALAAKGERDPDRLCEAALSGIANNRR